MRTTHNHLATAMQTAASGSVVATSPNISAALCSASLPSMFYPLVLGRPNATHVDAVTGWIIGSAAEVLSWWQGGLRGIA